MVRPRLNVIQFPAPIYSMPNALHSCVSFSAFFPATLSPHGGWWSEDAWSRCCLHPWHPSATSLPLLGKDWLLPYFSKVTFLNLLFLYYMKTVSFRLSAQLNNSSFLLYCLQPKLLNPLLNSRLHWLIDINWQAIIIWLVRYIFRLLD